VPLTTVMLLTVTPVFVMLTVAPETKFVPVRVTGTLAPCAPLVGLMALRVGAAGLTVKTTAAEVPFAVVTVTLAGPVAAVAPIAKLAVIVVALTTVTLLTVTPVFEMLTVAPETKFVPVRVTGTVVPCAPLVGLMEASVGAAGLTVKTAGAEETPAIVTVTLAAPRAAVAPIVKLVVIVVELTTLTLPTVTPPFVMPTVALETKFVPLSVTGTVVPCTPAEGEMPDSVGPVPAPIGWIAAARRKAIRSDVAAKRCVRAVLLRSKRMVRGPRPAAGSFRAGRCAKGARSRRVAGTGLR